MFNLTIQENIKLDDGGFNLMDSWFTIIAFIIFPALMAIVYFWLKKQNQE